MRSIRDKNFCCMQERDEQEERSSLLHASPLFNVRERKLCTREVKQERKERKYAHTSLSGERIACVRERKRGHTEISLRHTHVLPWA